MPTKMGIKGKLPRILYGRGGDTHSDEDWDDTCTRFENLQAGNKTVESSCWDHKSDGGISDKYKENTAAVEHAKDGFNRFKRTYRRGFLRCGKCRAQPLQFRLRLLYGQISGREDPSSDSTDNDYKTQKYKYMRQFKFFFSVDVFIHNKSPDLYIFFLFKEVSQNDEHYCGNRHHLIFKRKGSHRGGSAGDWFMCLRLKVASRIQWYAGQGCRLWW